MSLNCQFSDFRIFFLEFFFIFVNSISLLKLDSNGEQLSKNEVLKIIEQQVDSVLGLKTYNRDQVDKWVSLIVDQILLQLTKLNTDLKFIVHCVIMQKTGAGLHMGSSCFWDNSNDSSYCYKLETNKSMYCVVTVFTCSVMI